MASSSILALDTESNSRHYYPEQFCLLQLASQDKVFIVDTIALPDISPLEGIFSDTSIEKVIHSADYDLRSLDRHCGIHVSGVFDTSIAARFTGMMRLGLDTVLKESLGLDIEKSKSLQRSNWGRRPLTEEALEYAAGDVRYLAALRDSLEERLVKLGRASWVAEECCRIEEVRYTPPDAETAFLSIKGTKDLDGRQLAVLQSLYLFREEEAIRQHRPPFFIMPDSALVFLSLNPSADLSDVPGLGSVGLNRFGQGLTRAVREGIAARTVNRPRSNKFVRFTEQQIKRLGMLKEWRTAMGTSLSLDPSLLWPMPSLERLAREPSSFRTEINHDSIRQWQRDVVGESLEKAIKETI